MRQSKAPAADAADDRMADPPWRATSEGVVIACRLTPKGGRDAIEGVSRLSDGRAVLLARVRAAPEDGRANAALCALIAKRLALSASSVRLVGRMKSRLKEVAVRGDPAALITRLTTL